MVSSSMPTLSPNHPKMLLAQAMSARRVKALTITLATTLITPIAPDCAASRTEEYRLQETGQDQRAGLGCEDQRLEGGVRVLRTRGSRAVLGYCLQETGPEGGVRVLPVGDSTRGRC